MSKRHIHRRSDDSYVDLARTQVFLVETQWNTEKRR